jgi:hypothetical protein
MSAALFGHSLTLNFCVGIAIVFISMHYFFSMGGLTLQMYCDTVRTSVYLCSLRV